MHLMAAFKKGHVQICSVLFSKILNILNFSFKKKTFSSSLIKNYEVVVSTCFMVTFKKGHIHLELSLICKNMHTLELSIRL